MFSALGPISHWLGSNPAQLLEAYCENSPKIFYRPNSEHWGVSDGGPHPCIQQQGLGTSSGKRAGFTNSPPIAPICPRPHGVDPILSLPWSSRSEPIYHLISLSTEPWSWLGLPGLCQREAGTTVSAFPEPVGYWAPVLTQPRDNFSWCPCGPVLEHLALEAASPGPAV